jgi:hypothetical protein
MHLKSRSVKARQFPSETEEVRVPLGYEPQYVGYLY